jgi:D-alanyl-D-alanine carboxypeptidase
VVFVAFNKEVFVKTVMQPLLAWGFSQLPKEKISEKIPEVSGVKELGGGLYSGSVKGKQISFCALTVQKGSEVTVPENYAAWLESVISLNADNYLSETKSKEKDLKVIVNFTAETKGKKVLSAVYFAVIGIM